MDNVKSSSSLVAKVISLVVIAVLSSLCLVGLSGCAGPSPTEVTQQFLDGIKNNDTESIQEVYGGDTSTMLSAWQEDTTSKEDSTAVSSQEMQDLYQNTLMPKLREFDYEVSNEQINGDTATVDVTITTYAVGDAFSSFLSDYMNQAVTLAFSGASEDDLTVLAESILDSKINSMEKSYTDTVTISLTKSDNTWKVDTLQEDGEVEDALLGGLLTIINSYGEVYDSGE